MGVRSEAECHVMLLAGTNEATSEVLQCDLNIEKKLYYFKCLQMYF